MSRDAVTKAVFQLPYFQIRLRSLVLRSVLGDFPGIATPAQADFSGVIDWSYLLTCGGLLAQSRQSEHQDAALRIAQASLQLTPTESNLRLGGATLLESLANNPTLALSIRRQFLPENYLDQLPAPLRLDICRRRIETTVVTAHGQVKFTRFQAEVYRGAAQHDWVSVSAPTSAGKSFVLNRIIAEHLDRSHPVQVAYIVPTRALIQQVIQDLTELNRVQGRTNCVITALPKLPSDLAGQSCIFVLTQERMYWLLGHVNQGLSLSLLVLDEAQKIGDGSRGILMQQVLESTVRVFPGLRVLFSSPLTTNPELLVEDVPQESKTKYLTSEQPTVNQNLLWAEQKRGHLKEWEAGMWVGGKLERLGEFQLPADPDPAGKRLAFVAFAMTKSAQEGGCLIYVDYQAVAETTAHLLSELRDSVDLSADPEIDELIKLVKKTIHPQYLLVRTLPKGVAYHYGNMPLLVRTEIERLFKLGKIRFLVCTSTLIEGVNLPAKYIFVRAPKKGRKDALTPGDFWNLAGRAGRLGAEFQGSVVCVDPKMKVWKEPPPTKRVNTPIKRALDDVMGDHAKFLDFLSAETVAGRPQRKPAFEHTLGYCAQMLARGESFKEHAWVKRFSPEALAEVEDKVRTVLESIQVKREIIERNAGVSPVAQQRLLEYFRGYAKDPVRLIPYAPADPDAVNDSYVRIITNLSKYLSGDPVALAIPRAILVVNWMRGFPLRRMIDANIEYWVPRGEKIPEIIRKTMEEVEQYARFTFVKFVSCYLDILRQHLTETNRPDLVAKIPELQLYAEFGASQKTHMSLMDIGLSRIAAIELASFMINMEMDRAACLAWIRSDRIIGLDLSPILLREIQQFRGDTPSIKKAPESETD